MASTLSRILGSSKRRDILGTACPSAVSRVRSSETTGFMHRLLNRNGQTALVLQLVNNVHPGMGMPLLPDAGDGPPSSEGCCLLRARPTLRRQCAAGLQRAESPRGRYSRQSAGAALLSSLGDFRFQLCSILQFGRTPAVFSARKACGQRRDLFQATFWSRSCWQPAGSTTLLFAYYLLSCFYRTQVEWHGNSSGTNNQGLWSTASISFCQGAAVSQSYDFRACLRQDLLVALLR